MIGWGGGASFPKILQREVKQKQRNPQITFGTKLKVTVCVTSYNVEKEENYWKRNNRQQLIKLQWFHWKFFFNFLTSKVNKKKKKV